jgi:hypothetical protein
MKNENATTPRGLNVKRSNCLREIRATGETGEKVKAGVMNRKSAKLKLLIIND